MFEVGIIGSGFNLKDSYELRLQSEIDAITNKLQLYDQILIVKGYTDIEQLQLLVNNLGYRVGLLLMNDTTIEAFRKLDFELVQCSDKIKDALNKCIQEYNDNQKDKFTFAFDENENEYNDFTIFDYCGYDNNSNLSISELKRRIKHSKNPMERKQYQIQLNEAYKFEHKRKRRYTKKKKKR